MTCEYAAHGMLHALRPQEDGKLGAVAVWEHKTDARIAHNAANARCKALRAARAAEIDLRRARLAEKLAGEEAALKQELAAARQTPAERRADMAARAREMAARREGERQVGGAARWDGRLAAARRLLWATAAAVWLILDRGSSCG